MKRIDVQINHKLAGTCEAVIRSSSPLFKDIIDPWIEIEGFIPVSPSLTDDQQVVLDWLKERLERKDELTEILWELVDGTLADECYSIYGQAWKRLSKAEQFQVLAAFAEWGMANA